MTVLIKKRKKKFTYICIAVLILLFIFIGIFFIGIFFGARQKQALSFSTEQWINGDDTERYRMLDDLTANYNLIGMHTDEVKTLLGAYDVGHGAFLSDAGAVDYYWGYVIRFDDWEGREVLLIGFKDDIVVKYELAYLSEL